jgi:hypothetical protein
MVTWQFTLTQENTSDISDPTATKRNMETPTEKAKILAFQVEVEPGYLSGIALGYGLDGPGFESR